MISVPKVSITKPTFDGTCVCIPALSHTLAGSVAKVSSVRIIWWSIRRRIRVNRPWLRKGMVGKPSTFHDEKKFSRFSQSKLPNDSKKETKSSVKKRRESRPTSKMCFVFLLFLKRQMPMFYSNDSGHFLWFCFSFKHATYTLHFSHFLLYDFLFCKFFIISDFWTEFVFTLTTFCIRFVSLFVQSKLYNVSQTHNGSHTHIVVFPFFSLRKLLDSWIIRWKIYYNDSRHQFHFSIVDSENSVSAVQRRNRDWILELKQILWFIPIAFPSHWIHSVHKLCWASTHLDIRRVRLLKNNQATNTNFVIICWPRPGFSF